MQMVRIPTKPATYSDLKAATGSGAKPATTPRRSRTGFRSDVGHLRRRPCGSLRME